jgi:hypothetical protein
MPAQVGASNAALKQLEARKAPVRNRLFVTGQG